MGADRVPGTQEFDFRQQGIERKLYFVWSKFPRPYPPGTWLLFAPGGLLYGLFGASMRLANTVTMLELLLLLHLCLFFLLRDLFEAAANAEESFKMLAYFGILPLFLLFSLRIALAGQYDVVVVFLFFSQTIQSMAWHGLFLLPLVAWSLWTDKRVATPVGITSLVYAVLFGNWLSNLFPFSGALFQELILAIKGQFFYDGVHWTHW